MARNLVVWFFFWLVLANCSWEQVGYEFNPAPRGGQATSTVETSPVHDHFEIPLAFKG
jgi:hypothetical protein